MRLVHSLAALSVIAAGVAFVGGCAENNATLYIEHVLAQDASSDDCDTSPPGELYVPVGSYDAAAPGDYVAHLVVANQMVPLGDNETLRPETSRIQIKGAEVNIPGVDSYTVTVAAIVHPDASTDPGYVTVGVPMLPRGTPPGSYEVSVVVFGTTLGNQDIESGEFIFPITVYPEGSFAFCGNAEEAGEAGRRMDPCGRSGQDGYVYTCVSGQPQYEGCAAAGCDP